MASPRQTDLRDLDPLTSMVARAFASDPLMVWLLPDPYRRETQTLRWWNPIVARYVHAERGLTATDRSACVLWHHSHEQLDPAPEQPLLRDVVAELVDDERLSTVLEALAALSELRSDDAHVYVHVVAADPAVQNRGRGRELMEHLAATVDNASPIRLESTNPRNHSFYKRLGFDAERTIHLPEGGPSATAFVRRSGRAGRAPLDQRREER